MISYCTCKISSSLNTVHNIIYLFTRAILIQYLNKGKYKNIYRVISLFATAISKKMLNCFTEFYSMVIEVIL